MLHNLIWKFILRKWKLLLRCHAPLTWRVYCVSMEPFSTWLNSCPAFLIWPTRFVSWPVKTLNGFGLKPRRKHGVISRLPSPKPWFCVIITCKMRFLSSVTPLRLGWELLCFSFSSQWVSHPEPLPKLRPGRHKLRRSSWLLCLQARSSTSISLGVMLCMWQLITSL